MENIKKNFGFWCMRLPMKNGEVDTEQTCRMVDAFLEAFDWTGKTIHPFCTHEGSGLSGTERNIARTCKGAHVKAGLAICGSDVDRSKGLVLLWLNQ